ncbi:MAG: leucine-rich repeat domain-containing protein [Treponema sp.]|nr:leucine-rich repeat domain-containing protein [Treponema sp.]
MKKILLSIGFIFLIGLFPEQLFARELSRSEIDRSSFDYKSLITKVILIENDNERQRMLIEIKFHLSLHKYYSARISKNRSSVDGEYFVVYNTLSKILIAIGSSTFEINLYNYSQGNNQGISEIGENTYDKIVESIEMFEFINLVPVINLVPAPNPIYGIDPADIIPEIAPRLEQDGFEYEVVDGRSVTITGYTGNATILNIPERIQGLPVTAIGDYASFYCESLTSITIPSSVTFIGDWAFRGYSAVRSLTGITVDSRNPAYTSVDGVLFDKSIRTLIIYPKGRNQRTYVIPSSVTSIGDYAFSNCESLPNVTIPSSVTSIGDWAFLNCSSLTSVTIPSSVTSIGDHAFYGCSSLTSVAISSSVTTIGEQAFRDCESLTNVTIPSSVTSIGHSVFWGCSSLTSITVENRNPSYASIDGVLFDKNIRTLIIYPEGKTARAYTIPSSVTSIGDGAFIDSSLTNVTIPSSVTSIGDVAFRWCSNLTNVTIPSSVTSIGRGAFWDCSSLTIITVDNRNPSYASIDGVLFDKNIRTLIIYPQGRNQGVYVIPSSVTSIEDLAFSQCESLTSVIISSSVTSIGEQAFASCRNLTSVTIPSSVTSIGVMAFADCRNLTSVTIPSSVTSIGLSVFWDCDSLASVTLSRRTRVGEGTFPETARIIYSD